MSRSPWSGWSWSRSMANRLDLPLPLAPVRPTFQPGWICSVAASMRTLAPRARRKLRRLITNGYTAGRPRVELKALFYAPAETNSEPAPRKPPRMIRIRTQFSAVARRRSLVSGLFATVLASAILPAHAQTEDAAARAAERARAEALEADGKALRAEAEATYEATVPGCYDKFFVNRCIDQAKKKRLETVKRARELEAESRRLTLAERQRVAAEAGAKAERPLTPATPTALPATPAAAVSA